MDTEMDVKCEHQLSTDLDALKRAESSAALPSGIASSNAANFASAIASTVPCCVVLRLGIPLFCRVMASCRVRQTNPLFGRCASLVSTSGA